MVDESNAMNEMTFRIGGDLPVRRLGFGAMRLTGPGVWGPPADRENALMILRRAVELGVTFIDTADVYGPGDNERLIREALHPYPAALVIATKGGMVRSGPATADNPGIGMNGTEDHIRKAVDGSLQNLGVSRIDLYQLHRIDPATPLEATMRVLRDLRDEGKIRHIGLSEVGVEEIERARRVADIATVQNVFNLATRHHAGVLDYCERNGIGFVPFYPQSTGALAQTATMTRIAASLSATPRQVALAWLLQTSPALLPIPGTSSLTHLEENMAACEMTISGPDMKALDALA